MKKPGRPPKPTGTNEQVQQADNAHRALFEHLYGLRGAATDWALTTISRAGEARAAPICRCVAQPLPVTHAVPLDSDTANIPHDFGGLLRLTEQITP